MNDLDGMERINLHGEGKADVFADAIKHDHKSKNPTTRWSDIIELLWGHPIFIYARFAYVMVVKFIEIPQFFRG